MAELIGSSTLTVGKTVGQTDGATARSVHAQLGATIAGAVYWNSGWAGTIYPSAHKLRKKGHHDNCTQHVLSKMPSWGERPWDYRLESEEVGYEHMSVLLHTPSYYYPIAKVHEFQFCIIAKWITHCW